MGNKFDEMRAAVAEANMTLRAADEQATDLAALLMGGLRKVRRTDIIASLKRELRDFDAHKKEWKL